MDSTCMLKSDFKKRTQNWAEEGVGLDGVEKPVEYGRPVWYEIPKDEDKEEKTDDN